MNNVPNKLAPIILGTTVITFLSVMPLLNLINIFFCAGVVLGGYAASNSYVKLCIKSGFRYNYKDSVIIGLLSGLLSGIIVALVNLLFSMFSNENPGLIALEFTEKIPNFPQSIKDELTRISQEYIQYGFSKTIALITIISNIVIYPIFSMFGSLIGISVAMKRQKPQGQ